MNTVPGPENLQTSPSPLLMPEMIPPLATRSITYLQFQATRWPLSMMYFSPSTSYDLCKYLSHDAPGWKRETYIFPNDSPEARQPQNPRPTHLVDEQSLSREHGFAKPLVLQLLHDTLRGSHEGIFAYIPLILACKTQGGDVSEEGGSEEDFAWAGVCGCHDLTASDELLHGELDGAFEGYSRGHCDHDS